MKVFITGATGFVGGRVAQALIDRGDDVTILARSPDKAAKAFPSAQIVGGEITRSKSKVCEHTVATSAFDWTLSGILVRAICRWIRAALDGLCSRIIGF